MKKVKTGIVAVVLAAAMMIGLVSMSTVTALAEELTAEDTVITTAGITLKVGEAWALTAKNIEALFPADATDLTAAYDYGYWQGSDAYGVELDNAYLTSVYAYEVLDAITYESLAGGYGTEAELDVVYENLFSGALDEQYGKEVTVVESGSPYYVRAEKVGNSTMVIPAFYVGEGETETTLCVEIPVTIIAAGASSPTVGTVVTTPVESEHTLPSGEEVRMVTVKGNSSIYVIGNPAYIPTGATFSSTALTTGDIYTKAADAIQKKFGVANFSVFEMSLTDASNQAISQLAGYINVTLPIPAGMNLEAGQTICAYRLEADGSLTKLDTAVANGQVTFATNHFSTYVLVEVNAMTSPKTGDTFIMMPAVIFAIAIAGVAVIVSKKKTA